MIRLYILFTLLLVILACSKKELSNYKSIECDLENSEDLFFISNCGIYKFPSANHKSETVSRSGKTSVQTHSGNPYALEFKLENVKKDEFYRISIWVKSRLGKYNLMVTSVNDTSFASYSSEPVYYDSKGWSLLVNEFSIADSIAGKTLKMFVWNTEQDTAYFDDLVIVKYPKRGDYGISDKSLDIDIDSANFDYLSKQRDKILLDGIIIKDDSSWVPAEMKYGKKKYKIDLRFKGDWSDHLYTDKWSFRIKIKKDKTWKGMKVFSIHSPDARNYLSEWLVHKAFEKEDILTSRYEFIPVKLNGKPLGVYAYEEHFEKQLVENRNRREGVIVKFMEDLMWIVIKENLIHNNIYLRLPFFESSTIVPFKIESVLESKVLRTQFLIAQNLMFQYKNQLIKSSDIFEIDKLAKYYALADVYGLSHGCYTWHNLRFYYNPVLCKLEPIMFDGYSDSKTKSWMDLGFLGYYYSSINDTTQNNRMMLILHPLSDKKFRDLYKKYLTKYASKEYFDKFFNEISDEYTSIIQLLQKEYPYYNFDKEYVYSNIEIINKNLQSFLLNEDYINTINKIEQPIINTQNDTLAPNWKFIKYYLRAFIQMHENDNYKIGLNNFYYKSLKIHGLGKNENEILIKLDKDNIIKPVNEKNWLKEINVKSKDNLNYIFVSPIDKDTLIAIKIYEWNLPNSFNPRQELEKSFDIYKSEYFIIDGNKILFKNINVIISKNVVIPKGFKVIIEESQKIDLINKSVFISYSPIEINGTKEKPVLIKSSDNTANGFTILQAEGKSIINYATFDGLNTLDYKGWTLTGAVNFYESSVEISNTNFINNVCEDGLNIIRSEFVVKDSKFENIFSDAFDSDFSNGSVINCTFNYLNNDAIDFSGSNVEISDCKITNAKDKAVSGGEKSKMKIKNLDISKCNIGIASKDKSKLEVDNVKISDCNYGFLLLQKKPEFGDAKINATNIKLINNKTAYLIEKGSEFILEGKEIKGTEKKLAKQFYQ